MTIDFSVLLKEIESGVVAAAIKDATAFVEQTAADTATFVAASTASIAKYISLYSAGQITADELKSLLLGLGDLAAMDGLKAAGLAEIEIEKIRDAAIQALVSIVGAAIKSAIA